MEELQELIKGCAANNMLSQEKLYRKFYPALFLLCKKFIADDRDALEALNDGMLKVYKNIAKYKTEKGDFFNWVYTIIRNTVLDKLKIVKLPVSQELKADIKEEEASPLNKLEWKDIYILLDSLNPSTRAVCSLFYLEGFSVTDISECLQISTGTVKWHLSETRRKLKPVMEKYYT